jgi:hypothetical protein
VSVVCRLGWKIGDKVCRSGRVLVQSTYTYHLQCVSLLVGFELLTCGRTKVFLQDLQSNACLWDVHCVDYKTVMKKAMWLMFLPKKYEICTIVAEKKIATHPRRLGLHRRNQVGWTSAASRNVFAYFDRLFLLIENIYTAHIPAATSRHWLIDLTCQVGVDTIHCMRSVRGLPAVFVRGCGRGLRVTDYYSHPLSSAFMQIKCLAPSLRWMNIGTWLDGRLARIRMQDSFSYPVSKPESYWISLLPRVLVTVVLTDVAAPRCETLTIQAPPPCRLPVPPLRWTDRLSSYL